MALQSTLNYRIVPHLLVSALLTAQPAAALRRVAVVVVRSLCFFFCIFYFIIATTRCIFSYTLAIDILVVVVNAKIKCWKKNVKKNETQKHNIDITN